MWVVKISGSLNRDPLLPLWLELMAQLGGGRVTIVCGGGSFAEEARHANVHWRFDHNLHAHNMAVLAMSQAAYLALGLEPRLCLAVRADPARLRGRGLLRLLCKRDAGKRQANENGESILHCSSAVTAARAVWRLVHGPRPLRLLDSTRSSWPSSAKGQTASGG